MTDERIDVTWFEERLDRHGADFGNWPDRVAARRARELVLADPAARAALDRAQALATRLDQRFETIAQEAERSRLAERLVHATAPALSQRSGETRRWTVRIAASFLMAALLGGALESRYPQPLAPDEVELLALDTLLYGPGEGDLP